MGIATGAAVALVVLVITAAAFVLRSLGAAPMTPYVAPSYWLGYQDGFVRRGLPGALLRILSGGQAPSLALVNAAAVGVTAAALAALLVLAVVVARPAGDRWTALGLAAGVVASPLTLSHTARDLGRPDAVGVVVAVAVVALPWARLPPAVAIALLALLTTAAVAAEELLAVLVLPLAWLVVRTTFPAGRRRWPVLAVLPGIAVAVLSSVTPAPPRALARALTDAAAAGVPPPTPMPGGPADHDAVSRLGHGLLDNMVSYYATTSVLSLVVTTVVWAASHLLLLGVVWRLLGRDLFERRFVLLVAGSSGVALALSVAGIDFRRWWALASVGALCVMMRLPMTKPPRAAVPVPARVAVALVVLAISGLLLRTMPVLPLQAEHLERLLQGLG